MDQEKAVGPFLRGTGRERSANWNEFITFLTDDIFGKEICDFIRSHRPKLKPPQGNEEVLNILLEDWEWRLWETSDAIKSYLKEHGAFLPQTQDLYFGRVAEAMLSLFWSEVRIKHLDLWRWENIGIRADESGDKFLVAFRDSSEGMSLGPFKIMGPHGRES